MKTKLLIAFFACAGFAFAAPEAPTAAAASIPSWLDLDGDGMISEFERQNFMEARRSAAGSLQEQWDTDGNGVIDEEEQAAAIDELKASAMAKLEELFVAAAGDDELLSSEEFAALAPEGMPEMVVNALFTMLDIDGDLQVTFEEFISAAAGGVSVDTPSSPPTPTLPPLPSVP